VRILAIAALAARIVFIFLWRIDADEPQHLHIAWAWTRGLVQYRDVFDPHFPLLHLLFAPLLAIVPESSTVLLLARFAILPFAVGCSWLLYKLAQPLIGDRGAAVAAIAFSVMPPWLPKSVEFRNDTLWIFFWLAAALFFVKRRPFLSGVMAALCILASVKALPLLAAHALAERRRPAGWPAAVLGGAIPLLAVALFFAAQHALADMFHQTLLFGTSIPVHPARRVGGALAFVAIAPVVARTKQSHLAQVALFYPLLLLCFWPKITPREFLPLLPLAALGGGQTILSVRTGRWTDRIVCPPLVIAAALLASILYARLWRPADHTRQRFLDAAVALTAPGDYVLDMKGDAVFRRRPVSWIYENVRLLIDRGPEEIAARGCCVAVRDADLIPPRTRAFLNQHFIDRGTLRVCGAVAKDGAFTTAVPQTYAVIARDPSHVVIDGVPYRGPRFLTAGKHTLTAPEQDVTVIWWRAAIKEGV
jgi:hypothetical protein